MTIEILCPVTERPCIALTKEAMHPGKEILHNDGVTRKFVNNTMNADIARQLSSTNPESCIIFQDSDVCGAIYSQFVKIWTPLTDDLDKFKTRLEGLE